MRWRDAIAPPGMSRVALVATRDNLRQALVRVADAGVMEIDRTLGSGDTVPGPAARALQRLTRSEVSRPAALAATEPDIDELIKVGRTDLLAGEAELDDYRQQAIVRGEVTALVGWVPSQEVPGLAARLAPVGAALAPLARPPGVQPPTARRAGPARRAFAPLVEAYATAPYADVDATVVAGLAYVVMFGAMFGDVGHGALLLLAGLLIRFGRRRRLASLRPHWLIVAAAGVSSAIFGLLYGECFGPTGLVSALWLTPVDDPVPMLVAGVGLGALLLAGAYLLGTINRVREGGWAVALYAPSGLAGTLLFLAAGLATLAWSTGANGAGVAAAVLAVVGLSLAFVGLLAAAGVTASGVLQASVELLDVAVRLGTNVISFARLAAFGLTHAVLGWIVWQGSTALWGRGGWAVLGAVVVFTLGTATAFALEALVAAVQALRLEYYELFSRVFQLEGRPFRPWHVPAGTGEPTGTT